MHNVEKENIKYACANNKQVQFHISDMKFLFLIPNIPCLHGFLDLVVSCFLIDYFFFF